MKYYMYDVETGEYVREGEAQPSPREPGKYLMPSNATTMEVPEAVEGYCYCWDKGKGEWVKTEDHRRKRDGGGVWIEGSGTPYWTSDDNYESPGRYWDKIGPLPEGVMTTPPEMTEEEKAFVEYASAKEERNKTLSDYTVMLDGMEFYADERAQERLLRVVSVLGKDEKVSWVLADKSVVEVTVGLLSEVLEEAVRYQVGMWVTPYVK